MKTGIVFIVSVLVLLIIPCLTFFIKADSSNGRLLIYKLSSRILKDHFISGIGWGNFGIVYADYQAEYFSKGNFNEKELLLADNTKHAFNDYLQLIIEIGATGIALLILIVSVTIWIFRKALEKNPAHPVLLILAIIQVTAVCIAAFFTHVFEVFFFQALVALSFFCIVFYARLSFKSIKINILFAFGIMTFLTWSQFQYHILNVSHFERLDQSKKMLQAGYLSESYNQLVALYPNLHKDEGYLSFYAQVLVSMDKYEEAIKILNQLLSISNTSFYSVLQADCYYHTGNLTKAEFAYIKGINLVPCKFRSRLSLFEFYVQTGQYPKAVTCGRIIIDLPVKISSPQVSYIKKYVSDKIKECFNGMK